MNRWTSVQRRWRKNSKRGVSPIIATILLVAITVVLAAVLYVLISGLTKGPGNTPIGTALALGSPNEASVGSGATLKNWYNFSIQSAGGGLIMNNLNFQIQTSSGSIVPLTNAVSVLSLTGSVVATYSTGGSWTLGGTLAVTSQQTISVLSGPAATSSLSGDVLVVSGSGSFQGSISQSIP